MKKIFLVGLLCLGLVVNAYAGSTKIEDESGVGAVLNEDAAHASGQPGMMGLTVRKDTAAALAGTDADYQPLITDANGRLHVIEASASSGLTALQLIDDVIYADDADWTNNSSKHALVGGLYESSPQSITDGDVGPLEVTGTGSLRTETTERAVSNSTIIATTLLDDNPTSATSSSLASNQFDAISFWVSYDETEVGNSVSVAVTLDASYDGTNWMDAQFYDYAGGATPQTSETISADGWYMFWADKNICTPYYRVVITATNTDADDTASVACYASGRK